MENHGETKGNDKAKTGLKHYRLFYQSIQNWFNDFYDDHKEDDCCCITNPGHLELGELSSQNPKSDVCCYRDHEDGSDCEPTCFWTHYFFYKGLHRTISALVLTLYSFFCGWLFGVYDLFYLISFLLRGEFGDCYDYVESFFKLIGNIIFHIIVNFLECIWCAIAYSVAWISNLCCCSCWGSCLQCITCIFDCPSRCKCCMGGCGKCWKSLKKAMEDPDTAK